MKKLVTAGVWACALGLFTSSAWSSAVKQTKGDFEDKFRQLDEVLPTPNDYRNAAGEPGKEYWQQQVDYIIDAKLDEKKRRITANERITYHNNSPYTLKYLWLQLEQNRFKPDSISELTIDFSGTGGRGPSTRAMNDDQPAGISLGKLRRNQFYDDNEIGYTITNVKAQGQDLPFTINSAQMRVDLLKPLKPGETFEFSLDFAFNILEEDAVTDRGGYEHFPDDARKGGNDIFLLAQWFPRLASYSDYEAWHNKEFLGRGEFTLEFGNYDVKMTVPADHIVASTGVLQNENDVLTATQKQRLEKAKNAKRPVFIVTADEALENEKEGTRDTKTWHFKAENVRDFAWASSRKFMWDAKGYHQGGEEQPFVMAMSYYPKEGGDLWKKYSTEAIIHTMDVYSRYTFDYPYPVSISVNGPVGGMEYPMITFNGPRTTWHEDGSRTYTQAEKRFLIGVVIHEVGHNYFPMIINSDERQWTWMDEGLNSFMDGVACREWDPTIPWGVEPRDVTAYMKSDVQVPVMTQSDSVLKLGPNAYTKPAVALNILREVILGRELFDFAFKEYAVRWKNKRPTPSDFFRTMEEASGVDLDWFWRGWFYTTDHVDISVDSVYTLRLDTKNPDIDFKRRRQEEADKPTSLFVERNKEERKRTWVELNKDVSDFYDKNDRFTVTNKERNKYKQFLADLDPWERKAFERAVDEDKNYYVINFSNLGGLVMPILLELEFKNGKKEEMMIPAEIWRRSPKKVSKLIVTDKKQELVSVVVDPHWETADVNNENNHYPPRIIPSRIESYKDEPRKGPVYRDIMHDIKTELKDPEVKEKRK
ncbi:M1 family metallopeptidase [Marinibactrum halimedae]|uniref:Aminopeptidase n=1 Tax=Marinibactrum halimedae TaxID=1444977 RepID=A0AA37T6P2_9GAMM|nr:M1 family aminopeptidase [Marinibactrum halimedae]MCD9459114.1 aminopeptidase [Marinibactrum halimedae]GLS24716.1 aminopeptidase [Marinibactrum halimedae]